MQPSAARYRTDDPASIDALVGDIQYYLTLMPRQLPSRYFYDPLGSALFEAICELPWYGITRAERMLLERHSREIFARVGSLSTLVELGPGSGDKLASLLSRGGAPARGLTVHLVDISAAALNLAERTLVALDPDLVVAPHLATYESGLADAMNGRAANGRAMTLFLGSNIGNFDPPGACAFLRAVRSSFSIGDSLLVGTDLVKSERDLLLAYDDPLGVTAAFNRNLLVRINRELGGNFDLVGFGHRAIWNARDSRVEMHLVAHGRQRVRINALDLDIELADGETIWTESSYKYRPAEIVSLVECTGFRLAGQWLADADQFALTLFEAA